MGQSPDIILFLGRFHPLLVHLPIGFLILLVVLETLARNHRFCGANASATYILVLLVPSALVTGVTGWMLSGSGEYDGRILQVHRWLGVAIAVLCPLLALLRWVQWLRAYAVCLYLSAGVLMAVSHFGGSLTHGSDYLFHYEATRMVKTAVGGQRAALAALVHNKENGGFEAVVHPVLEARCGARHNPEKYKGGLSMDTYEQLMSGGRNGPVIVAGDATLSPLITRMLLPRAHDDHMPPASKPQPHTDEIELLRRWVDAGAPGAETTNRRSAHLPGTSQRPESAEAKARRRDY